MAYVAMRGSAAVNGVSRLHGDVSRQIFQSVFPHWPTAEVPIGHAVRPRGPRRRGVAHRRPRPALATGRSAAGRHSPFDQAIDRQRARTTQDESRKAGEVQEITFVAYRPELSAGGSHGYELDRAEPVGQMHSEDSHHKKSRHG
jgi:hypothetical protein